MKSMRFFARSGANLLARRGWAAGVRGSVLTGPAKQISLAARARSLATAAAADLRSKLESQIAEETEMAKKNLEGREPPTIPGFKIDTDEAEVRLTKQLENGHSLKVTFNVNHSVDADSPVDEPGQEQASQPQSGDAYMMAKPSFTVEIGPEGGQKLTFECQLVGEHGEEEDAFTIDEVYVNSGELSEKVYATSGPIIDASLYDSLMDYLEEAGIDNKWAENVVEFATHYEHAQYVALLKRIKDFIAK